MMVDLQAHFIFPVHAVPPSGPMPPGAERLLVSTPDGDTLEGVRIPPDDTDASSTLILGFGGNAWNGQDVAEYLHQLFPTHEVVAFHYRGYAPSTGLPSAEALIADAPLVYDKALAKTKCATVVVVGLSIGTGVAAQLSSVRKVAGLILVTPFDSLKGVAQSMYPWLPIGPLFAHEIDAAAPLVKSPVPVALIAAKRDEIVPAERTAALRKGVGNLAYDRTIARCGHNDIYAKSDFHEAMREALALLMHRPSRSGAR
jgi:pimeloyl-ACP methyl ester carboxylesterase